MNDNDPQHLQGPAKRHRGSGRGGNFFVLDRGQWSKVGASTTNNRLNLATAYLVMLAGTGADHRVTKWSVAAIHRYCQMRKEAARAAIQQLVSATLVELAPGTTRMKPLYIITAGQKGAADVIFLPKGLVTGLAETDTPMLMRLREVGDPLLLHLLIQLYGLTTTDAAYGVALPSLRAVAAAPAAERIAEVGAHAIWKLQEPDSKWVADIDRTHFGETADGRNKGFWAGLKLLQQMGAVISEPWLCSNDTAEADPIFPLAPETQVGRYAEAAARALLAGPDGQDEWRSEQHEGPLVVLPAHHQAPAIQSVFKLRVEADTPARRAAYGERQRIVEHWIEEYARLDEQAFEGVVNDPLRTFVAGDRGPGPQADRPHQGDQRHKGGQGGEVLSRTHIKRHQV